MSSVEIFNSGTNLLITLVALIILMLSVWYSSQDIKIGKGIRYLFVGLVLEFIGSWFGYQMNEYYQLGISINILAFLELFILLLSMMFLALSASQLLVSSIPDTPVIGAITVLGLVAIIYFVSSRRTVRWLPICARFSADRFCLHFDQFLVAERPSVQNRFSHRRFSDCRRHGSARLPSAGHRA